MAFRILTEEEVALLTERQRIQYEDALETYRQRVAFVERIAALEDAEITPYEPKLESIDFISGVEVRAFRQPKYEVALSEPVSKPQFTRGLFEMPELVTPDTPKITAAFDVPVGRTVKIKPVQPKLPKVIQPAVEGKRFVQLKRKQPVLPEVTPNTPKIAATFDMSAGRTVKIKPVQPKLPKIIQPVVEGKRFVQSKRKQFVLPEVAKPVGMAMAWYRPQIGSSELPTVATPVNVKNFNFDSLEISEIRVPKNIPDVYTASIETKPFVMPEKTQPELPGIHIAFAETKPFSSPEKANINLPTTVKPDVKAVSFTGADISQPELPKISALNIDIRAFKIPKSSKPKVIGVSKSNFAARSIKLTKAKEPVLPVVARFDVPVKSFVAPEYTPDVAAPQAPSVKIKSMRKIKKANPKLPSFAKKSAVKIPDVNVLLNELFPGRAENMATEG